MSVPDRRAMIEPAGQLSVRRQCELLALARSGVHRAKAEVSAEDLGLMRQIDALHLELPFYGSRRMTFELNARAGVSKGEGVNRKRVQRLMRLMGLVAIYQRPSTSKPAVAHKVYPYLLGGIAIERVDEVWCSDVTPAFAGAGSTSRCPKAFSTWRSSWTG